MIFATRSAAQFYISATWTKALQAKHRVVVATRYGKPCGYTVVMIIKADATGRLTQ